MCDHGLLHHRVNVRTTTTCYPENINRKKITTRRRKIEIKNRKKKKITHLRGKREKNSSSQARKQYVQSKKPRKNTQENAKYFAHFRLARIARGVKQRQKKKKSICTPPLRTPGSKKETSRQKNYQVIIKKMK